MGRAVVRKKLFFWQSPKKLCNNLCTGELYCGKHVCIVLCISVGLQVVFIAL